MVPFDENEVSLGISLHVILGNLFYKRAQMFFYTSPNKLANSYRRPRQLHFLNIAALCVAQTLHFEKQFPHLTNPPCTHSDTNLPMGYFMYR